MNIVLIGYRGTGKSTVGKLLAASLHRPFLDADLLLVERAGKTIKQIFQEGGEPAFRELESQVVAELAQKDGHVIALGGGAVLRPQNLAAIRPNAIVVWLQADPQTLFERIVADTSTTANRPNLTSGGGLDEIHKLLTARTPLYQAAANITVDVAELSPEQAAARVLSELPPALLSDHSHRR